MDNLKVLLKGALGKAVPANFALEDYDYKQALYDEMVKLAGNMKEYRKNKYDIFELLASELDEELPRRVEAEFGVFAEIRSFANGQRMEFRVRKGVQRARQFITRVTPAGNYETFRLDHDRFDIMPVAIGGAGYIDFERYLEGLEDMATIYEIIIDGMMLEMWEMVQKCMLESWNKAGRPTANKVSVTSFDAAAMVKLCQVVRAYGDPIIYCTPEFAADMTNAIVYNSTTKIADEDLTDIRERGYIGKFHGVPVVLMPQSFRDSENTQYTIDPCFAYVVPVGKEKVVKIGLEGEAEFREAEGHDWTRTLHGYKKVGMGIANTPNYWGIYYNSGITAGAYWSTYNAALIP